MKYIQDENNVTLIVTFIVFIIICLLVIKWDIYETKQSQIDGEPRDFMSKFRLRMVIFMFLIGIFSMVADLYKRFFL